MKIIGKTNNGVILEASTDEVGKLCGYYCSSSAPRNMIEVGNEIHISNMFQTLYSLAHRHDEVKKAQATLRAMADALELPKPLTESIVQEVASHKPANS